MSNGIFMVERMNGYGYKVRLGTDDTGSESFTSDDAAWNKYATADAAQIAATAAGRESYVVDATTY